MAERFFTKGLTTHNDRQILDVFLRDSTTGMGKTALTYSSVTCYWSRQGDAAATQLTLAAGTAGTFVDSGAAGTGGGFIKIDDTNMPGHYQLSLSDAMLAASATVDGIAIHIKGTGVIDSMTHLTLTYLDFQDAVRGGLTALPNANAQAAGGLYTRGTGAGQINQDANGRIDTNAVAMSATGLTARDIGANVLISPGTGTGQLDVTSGVIKANLAQILGTALTETAGYLAAGFKKFFNVASPTHTVASVDQTGDGYSYLTTNLGALGANATALATAVWAVATRTLSAFGFTVATNSDSNVTAIKAKTDNLPASPAAVGSAMTLTVAYDAAKTAASASSVSAIPTTPLLASNYTAPDNTGIENIYSRLGAPVGASISADIATRLATSDYTAPSNASIATILGYTAPSVIAADVLDAPMASHITSNSVGAKINSGGGGGSGGGPSGPGAIAYPSTVTAYRITDAGGVGIADVTVWVSTDATGGTTEALMTTNGTGYCCVSGVATPFMLDAGTHYIWKKKVGYTFVNPEAITVTP